jgi:hypothetical protein
MQRWLISLSFAMVQYPDLAAASTKSSDVPFWKRVLGVLTPVRAARSAHQGGVHPERVRSARAVAAPNSPELLPGSPIHGPRTRSTGTDTDTGCSGGQRVVSAYYWEGQHTASGQPFDPDGMTAAHRTLPFGTRLTVTNPRTGKSVIVVVNDRGPFVSGVSLDLSLGAAKAIGMRGTGAICVSS